MSPETLALLSGRILDRVTVGVTTNCWICSYTPRPWSAGAPSIKEPYQLGRKDYRCDTIIYEFTDGTIPRHHTLSHLCQEPRCVNPDHMRVVRRKYRAGSNPKTYTKEDVDDRIAELRSQSPASLKRQSQTHK